jgi:hypothetical protein
MSRLYQAPGKTLALPPCPAAEVDRGLRRLPTPRSAGVAHPFRSVPRFAATVSLGLLLTSCGSVRTRTLEQGEVNMSQAQFAAQFERVFRYHNRITNELIMELPSLSLTEEDTDNLSDAEERMNEACDSLNEVASLEAVSQHADFWTQSGLPEAVPRCEEATHAVEDLFQKLHTRAKDQHELLPP